MTKVDLTGPVGADAAEALARCINPAVALTRIDLSRFGEARWAGGLAGDCLGDAALLSIGGPTKGGHSAFAHRHFCPDSDSSYK